MKYRGLETSYSLLVSYEILALQYKRKNEPRAAFSEEYKSGYLVEVPSKHYNNYAFTFALLNINAAIVEGIMRSILSEIVSAEVEHQIKEGTKAGRTERSSPENLLKKFFIEIDAQGGWERLKEQYVSYLGLAIDKVIQPQTKDAISSLFLLRNILAHGTALIHPSEQLPDDMKDEPVFKWQSRLQSARVYLEKQFGHEDIFDNLAEYAVPEHFLTKTKDFLSEILPAINHKPQRAEKTITAVNGFSFGYLNISA
ncbi:hypothetical protein JWZ98_17575 [Methylomonas sp. EFPC1]|uniref:hypothetical protein n=1 Tax=Methylomonas sp. EFPC1 TaxID=2812647 RepID=UPI001966F42A|nr:hypothetical protein [Methylomonas sp. EFPC1]QSB00466.1 hypothetical protein JWZ98_17575 [Methylomonas sp. EFPC1]